jgi:hypothetical protein
MKEGMGYTAQLGGFWAIRVIEAEKIEGLYQATSTHKSQGDCLILTSRLPM